ncbi:MAG: hypothetical protein J1F63_02275 [Oscillospiraceae bacterium]|nr:hypothetical protein [Oscillospiraceae bacterium]
MKKTLIIMVLLLAVFMGGCGKSESKYYLNEDFLSDEVDVVYETKEKNNGWGKYQVEESGLNGDALELGAGGKATAVSQEEFSEIVKIYRDRLDAMETAYALGYDAKKATNVKIKIAKEKIGLPVLAILDIGRPDEIVVVSAMSDLKFDGISNFSYEKGSDGRFVFTVDVPEKAQAEYASYIKSNVGAQVYLKLGELTFSKTEISEDMPADKITFTGFTFFGNPEKNGINEFDYEYIAKLASQIVNDFNSNVFTSFTGSADEDMVYDVPYITEMDEYIADIAQEAYPGVRITRRSIANELEFYYKDMENQVLGAAEGLRRSQELFELCNFDGGAYSEVVFKWPAHGSPMECDFIIFKKQDGEMICRLFSDNLSEEIYSVPFFKDRMVEK